MRQPRDGRAPVSPTVEDSAVLGRLSRRPLSRAVTRIAGACAVLLLATGCGLIGSSGASPSASSGSGSSSFSSYLNCLRQHGVNVPTTRPTSAPGGGFGGFGGNSSTFQQARQACASLRPSGGFGGFGGGQFAAAFQAFRSCMSAHGEPIPSTRPTAPPTSPPSGTDRFLNGLNPDDPKVAAALKACESKLPQFPPAG
jgi:hypothetical protein